ncbi:MAG: hypothetical protein UV07_C0026G0006 [Candidatus Azambacteria bacterium GW2011_GWB1_42_17]|uniref:Uncharacterized protein n=2 Tax=Candidatus Azamiibacteriota TaxID=1752741 RepID=A0A0G0Z4R9_9BACT|nr:MAG: hypothetical protein UV07_C0026G0006 [Candidatus Azambacteria bacterium GW2011_GWB1_42_17]KKS87830.1 MAG: hypothetical protein UV62_C0024G0006 [Parcubacteria group bacterium GW2011_GWC1_43_11]
MITNLTTFKHNFWTNEFCHYLYEGRYIPIKKEHIERLTPALVDKKEFFNIELWAMEFIGYDPKYTFLALKGFSPTVVSLMAAWKAAKIARNTKVSKAIEGVVLPIAWRELLDKMSITKKQAQILMKIQTKEMKRKELIAIHKKIGFDL